MANLRTTLSDRTATESRPATAKEAVDRGESFYFDGKPCAKGHVAERSVAGGCFECACLEAAAFRAASDRARCEDALEKRRPELRAVFRKHVMAMAPGDRVHWGDMEAWVKTQFSYRDSLIDLDHPWEDPWSDVTLDCMVICGSLARSGWLGRTPRGTIEPTCYPQDDYIRTDKSAPKAGG
jgi:hypothetical protein